MRKPYNRLQLKITASMIVFIILPVMGINLILQLYFKNLILKNTNFAFENAVLNVDNSLNTIMREMGVTLNLLSTDPIIYNALGTKPVDFSEEIYRKINIDNTMAQYQKYVFYCVVDFLILDYKGIPYSTYYIKDPEILQTDETQHLLHKIAKNNLNYTYFPTSMNILGKTSDESVICIGKTIRNYKKELLGECVIIVNEDKIFQLLQKSTLYTDSINLLTDQDGMIVCAADKALIGSQAASYLTDKEDYYILSHKLSNKWSYTSLIRKSDLYKDSSYTSMVIILDIIITLGFIGAIFLILNSFLKPVKSLKALIANVENGDFTSRFHSDTNDELTDLGNCFNHMSENLALLFERTQLQQKKLLERENEKERFRYMVLQSQINPHLMFNTLNNIKWMALINKDQPVADTIASFGRLLEKTLKGSGDNFTIREELEYLQEYLQVMQLHTPQHIALDIHISDPALYDCLILKLLLQPMVENSILHGFKEECCSPRITITVSSDGNHLVCTVADNGVGMSSQVQKEIFTSNTTCQKPSHSIGLSNTLERVKLFYGNDANISIESQPEEGTKITLILPYISQ